MDLITAFKEHFATVTKYKLKTERPFNGYYEFCFAGLRMYVFKTLFIGEPPNTILEKIIHCIIYGDDCRLVSIYITSKTNVDLMCAPNCVISMHTSTKLKKPVQCNIVSYNCLKNKTSHYLEYNIVYADSYNGCSHTVAKVIKELDYNLVTEPDLKYKRLYGNAVYVYLKNNYPYKLKMFFNDCGVLCIILLTGCVIINESHELCSDLIEYMIENGHIERDAPREYFKETYLNYVVENGCKFFIDVDVHTSQKLIKNARK
jgi:hypothetical protein